MKIKFTASIIITLCLAGQLLAKKDTKTDSTKYYVWIPSAISGLNISQIALSNWAKGGDNSIAWTLLGNFGLTYINDNWTFNNSFKFAFGRTKLGTQDFRTNYNEIYLESVLSMHLVWDVRWDSAFISKINDYINVIFGVLIIYEKKQSLKTQLREGLQLGFTYTFL